MPFDRIRDYFGSPSSKVSGAGDWPELHQSWAGREIEMPKETAATRKVRPMNWYEKYWAAPDADAVTWPYLGTIALNRDLIEKNKQNLGDVLVHELTHVGQNRNTSILDFLKRMIPGGSGSYYEDPRETQAFEAERKRPVRRHDIELK